MNGMLPYSVKIFICMTVNIQKATKTKDLSQCIIQKSSETADMNMCMCMSDGACGLIYRWPQGWRNHFNLQVYPYMWTSSWFKFKVILHFNAVSFMGGSRKIFQGWGSAKDDCVCRGGGFQGIFAIIINFHFPWGGGGQDAFDPPLDPCMSFSVLNVDTYISQMSCIY